jgi:NADPH:quinone reductase-like Zn-dependent oxidoreductase
MRAVRLKEFGGPEMLVVGEAPEPVDGPGQALIEAAFSNVTFVETQFRAGGFDPFSTELPTIPGNGVVGVVSSVGAGADGDLIGKRVVSGTGGSGGYAERVAVDTGGLFEVPDGLDLDRAVALLADGRTATMLVRKAGLLSISGSLEIWHLAVGGLLIGAGESFFIPSYTALLPRLSAAPAPRAGIAGRQRPGGDAQAAGPAGGRTLATPSGRSRSLPGDSRAGT